MDSCDGESMSIFGYYPTSHKPLKVALHGTDKAPMPTTFNLWKMRTQNATGRLDPNKSFLYGGDS